MTGRSKPEPVRRLCRAVYTRKSSEEGLDMEFNNLNARRDACEAYQPARRCGSTTTTAAPPAARWTARR